MISPRSIGLILFLGLSVSLSGAEFQQSDLVGEWTGTANNGATIKYIFGADGSVAWFVDDPHFKADFPSGIRGKYAFRQKSPLCEIDIHDFESPRFKEIIFQGILQPLEKGKFKMEAAPSMGGPRPGSFDDEAIVFNRTGS
jgi:hypothetical protein